MSNDIERATGFSEKEAAALINEASRIDQGEAAHADAAANGQLDERGQIVMPDETAAAAEWFLVPKTLGWIITTIFPETEGQFSDARCMELAKAIVPVAEKHGLNSIGDSPELVLLIGTGMFCMPGYLAYRARKEAAVAAETKHQAVPDGR
jgi:hypothetical protein